MLKSRRLIQRRSPYSAPMDIEGDDIGYLASVRFGTPLQEFRLLLDSGSADIWVGGEQCKGDFGGSCGDHRFLGPNSSSSYRETGTSWYMNYGSGSVSGDLVNDTVKFADFAELHDHTFGVTKTESRQFTAYVFPLFFSTRSHEFRGRNEIPLDGVLGCAKQSLSMQQTPTFITALKTAGLIAKRIWSFKISRKSDGKNDGEVTVGAMDPSKFDPLSLVCVPNVSDAGFWEAKLDALTVNGQDVKLGNRSCIFDTGTSLFIAPKLVGRRRHHKSIPGAKFDNSSKAWTVPCNTTTSVELVIGGRPFPIQPKDLAFGPVDNTPGTCTSAIAEGGVSEGPTHWLCGDTFLKNVYLSTNEDTNQICVAFGT
ncbi:aspartic peptidase domain-containing protein [Mycena olivaceomarginata]|nr:aspartic peptidase domain-containing protein [Mycena olivaceomarginata]